jgi:hypothetical protein
VIGGIYLYSQYAPALPGKPKVEDPFGQPGGYSPAPWIRSPFGQMAREQCPPGNDDAKKRRREAEDECYEECKHLLGGRDLQSSEYRRCFRRCMFDKGFPGLPPD